MAVKPVLLPLSGPLALKIIHEAGKDSSRVFFTAHAWARMRLRRISMTQVLRCLCKGKISEGPAPDVMKGGWKCTVEHYTAGEQIGVSVGIETTESREVSVITVFHVG